MFVSHGVIHGPWKAPFFFFPPFFGLWRSNVVLKFAHLCPLCDDVDLVKIQPADLKIYEEMRHVAKNRKCVTSLITTTPGFFFLFFFWGGIHDRGSCETLRLRRDVTTSLLTTTTGFFFFFFNPYKLSEKIDFEWTRLPMSAYRLSVCLSVCYRQYSVIRQPILMKLWWLVHTMT